VLAFAPGEPVARHAFAILLDDDTGQTHEAVVSLTPPAVVSWTHVPDVQPSIMLDEFLACERACKTSPEWQAAVRKRGVTDFDLWIVDPWSAGNFGLPAENGPGRSNATRGGSACPARRPGCGRRPTIPAPRDPSRT
jgi:primary-amine oxidase